MGTIRNRMVIVHHYDKDIITEMRDDAIACFGRVAGEDSGYDVSKNMVSPILESYANEEYSFVIMGDCSKTGWDTSEAFKRCREQYLGKWRKSGKAYKMLEVNFGEDYPCTVKEYD